MAVIRNQPTKIKVYRTEAELLAAATGDVNLLYQTTGGVYIDFYETSEIYTIEIFQDTVATLHGLYKRT